MNTSYAYDRTGQTNVDFFVGPEVSHTTAYSKKTLFVCGKQDTARIQELATEFKTTHISLTANRCLSEIDQSTDLTHWVNQVDEFLGKGFMVTVEYPAHQHDVVLKAFSKTAWASRNFVPVATVVIPNISTTSQNLTLKIDDVGFGQTATNPGIWCYNHKELTDSNRFTGWGEFDDDFVIAHQAEVQPEPPAPVQHIAIVPEPAKSVEPPVEPIAPIAPVVETVVVEEPALDHTPETVTTVDPEPVQDTTEPLVHPTETAEVNTDADQPKRKGKK